MKRREWKEKKMKKEGTCGVQRELEKVRIEIWRKERANRYRSDMQKRRKRTAGLGIL